MIDHSQLMFDHHAVMISSLGLVGGVTWGEETVRVMVVGLGGGALPMFIRDHIPQVIQDVVEIDPKMVETAVEWFGFDYDSHMDPPANDTCINVIIDDAINYISSLTKTHTSGPLYHAIILDVDNKDDSTGITSPPIGFTTSEFLNSCHCLLHPNGIFVSNLAARNKEIDTAVINSVASCFPLVVRNYVAEHVNDVIVGFPVWRDDIASGGGLSHDGHVTNVAMATHLRSNSFSMSDVLRSHLESFSQCVYGKGNSELMKCFNDSVLFASN
jgi:spermidine synthase